MVERLKSLRTKIRTWRERRLTRMRSEQLELLLEHIVNEARHSGQHELSGLLRVAATLWVNGQARRAREVLCDLAGQCVRDSYIRDLEGGDAQ